MDKDKLRKKLTETLLSEGISITMSVAKALDEFIDNDVEEFLNQQKGNLLEEIYLSGRETFDDGFTDDRQKVFEKVQEMYYRLLHKRLERG